MDRLTAFVTIATLKLRLQYLSRHPEILEGIDMTPKLQGVRSAMAMLRHNLEADAEKLSGAIGEADAERTSVFAGAHAEIAATRQEIAEVKDFLADIKGSNGSPTSGGLSDTSDQSQANAAEPVRPPVNALGGPVITKVGG